MPIFSNPTFAREAIDTLYRVQVSHPFFLFGFVIMPDHCHFLLNVPEPGKISNIMSVYKSGVTFNTGLKKVWQARFHIREIKNPQEALKYIFLNPVRKSLVEEPEKYPWSSASGKWDVSEFGF